jgi:anti-sigma regulatory factor (Ser/Thr protein kinase)
VRLLLSPHITASRIGRDFVSRTCLDWGLAQGIASACLVVSELVTNGLRHAVTDMELALARHGGVLRLALRDHSADSLREQALNPDSLGGRGLALVAACSRAWGVLPTADGGKVVWTVLDV